MPKSTTKSNLFTVGQTRVSLGLWLKYLSIISNDLQKGKLLFQCTSCVCMCLE